MTGARPDMVSVCLEMCQGIRSCYDAALGAEYTILRECFAVRDKTINLAIAMTK